MCASMDVCIGQGMCGATTPGAHIMAHNAAALSFVVIVNVVQFGTNRGATLYLFEAVEAIVLEVLLRSPWLCSWPAQIAEQLGLPRQDGILSIIIRECQGVLLGQVQVQAFNRGVFPIGVKTKDPPQCLGSGEGSHGNVFVDLIYGVIIIDVDFGKLDSGACMHATG